ncbi:hypothetical protein [uncultured Sphingomonas sp.]|uniref:hypothetical protein n=1 Tax=uncultured Sphingomonas sp. TaxID=158754 RepID=UPI002600CC41|nr:hypothetical protein [uncultured Sphingomonas sp.]
MFDSAFVVVSALVLSGAGGAAVYAIHFTVAPRFRDILDALAGRPRLFASDEPDRWRMVHRRADRQRAFAPADPATPTFGRSKRA